MSQEPEIDWEMARACCALSAQAYSQAPTVESGSAHVLLCDHLRQAAAKSEERMIVAFRGTASLHDVITDARVFMVPDDGVLCDIAPVGPKTNARVAHENGVELHRGFLQAFTSVIDPVIRAIDGGPAGTRPKLVITGHSLGGALAMVCASALGAMGYEIDGVYTFGQPRVGNTSFALGYERRGLGAVTWRFVNEEDPVPRVPGVLAGYRHAGNEVFFPVWSEGEGGGRGGEGSLASGAIVNPPLWRKCVSDAWGFWREWKKGGPLECLGDHRVAAYCARLGVEARPANEARPAIPEDSNSETVSKL